MPTFPKYRGELPQCLNPCNPRHYCLLAYWVYFRPTALHCYLYEAAPEYYQQHGWSKIRRTWHIPAYRNLYLMAPVALLLFALLVGLMVGLYLLWTLQSHTSEVWFVVVTPDAKQVVSASDDKTLKVWDIKTGQLQHTLRGHTSLVWAVAVTPDGKQVVSASLDKTLKVWDIKSGQVLHTLNIYASWVIVLNDKQVISVSDDKTLKVWDIKTGQLQHTLSGHTDSVRDVAVTPDGKQVIAVSDDKTLKVWDIKTGQVLHTFKDSFGRVIRLAVTPDGKQVVSTSWDYILKVWDIKTGQLQHTLSGHTDSVRDVAVTPDGKQLVSASWDNTLKVWDIKTGQLQHTLSDHTHGVDAVTVTPDGKQVISASWDNILKIWDINSGQIQHTLSGHTDRVYAVAVTPDGKQVVSASEDNTLKVWDIKTGKAVPLNWAKVRLVALGLAAMLLCSLAIINVVIVFPIILALGAITFGVTGRSITGLLSSGLFSVGLGAAVALVFYVVAIRNEFSTLGVLHPSHTQFPTAFGIIFSIAIGILLSISLSRISRKTSGVLGSVIAILIIGVLAGLAFGIFSGVQLSASVEFYQKSDKEAIKLIEKKPTTLTDRINAGFNTSVPIITNTAIFALLVQLGNLRLPFYPFQLALALRHPYSRRKHPALWDELTVLPLPGIRRLLSQSLQQNEAAGLQLVSEIVRNPSQRWVAQQALQKYLHSQTAPLHLLYKILSEPDFDTYFIAPVGKQDWARMPTTGRLLIGELAGQWVDSGTGWSDSEALLQSADRISDRILWYLTRFRRDRRQTPLTRFARMLYEFLNADFINHESFDLKNYRPIYARLTDYPSGAEIEQSFDAMASFLS